MINNTLARVDVRAVTPELFQPGPATPATLGDPVQYLVQHGYTQLTTYQPSGLFWPFQWIEGGWLLVLSLLLIAATVLAGAPASGMKPRETADPDANDDKSWDAVIVVVLRHHRKSVGHGRRCQSSESSEALAVLYREEGYGEQPTRARPGCRWEGVKRFHSRKCFEPLSAGSCMGGG